MFVRNLKRGGVFSHPKRQCFCTNHIEEFAPTVLFGKIGGFFPRKVVNSYFSLIRIMRLGSAQTVKIHPGNTLK